MIKTLRAAFALLLLASSLSAHANWTTSPGTIRHIQFSIDIAGEGVTILFVENWENPNNCTLAGWFALERSHPLYREILASVFQANALRRIVQIYTTECTGDGQHYNVIRYFRSHPPSAQ